MSKTIKISDEIGRNLARIAAEEGNTMAAEIAVLISEHNITKKICDRLHNIEKAINNIQPSLRVQEPPHTSAQPESEDEYTTERTYNEILEETGRLQEKLETLDDDDPKRREIENRLRSCKVELSLLED